MEPFLPFFPRLGEVLPPVNSGRTTKLKGKPEKLGSIPALGKPQQQSTRSVPNLIATPVVKGDGEVEIRFALYEIPRQHGRTIYR